MKKTLTWMVLVAVLFVSGCTYGLYAVYKNPANGDILLVYEDGTTKRMPVLLDGAVLTGIIEYWQKNSGGLTPSPLALVQVNPDGTFKIKWVKGGPGLTTKIMDVIASGVQGAAAAAIGGGAGHSETGHGSGHGDEGEGHDGDADGDHDDDGEGGENGHEH